MPAGEALLPRGAARGARAHPGGRDPAGLRHRREALRADPPGGSRSTAPSSSGRVAGRRRGVRESWSRSWSTPSAGSSPTASGSGSIVLGEGGDRSRRLTLTKSIARLCPARAEELRERLARLSEEFEADRPGPDAIEIAWFAAAYPLPGGTRRASRRGATAHRPMAPGERAGRPRHPRLPPHLGRPDDLRLRRRAHQPGPAHRGERAHRLDRGHRAHGDRDRGPAADHRADRGGLRRPARPAPGDARLGSAAGRHRPGPRPRPLDRPAAPPLRCSPSSRPRSGRSSSRPGRPSSRRSSPRRGSSRRTGSARRAGSSPRRPGRRRPDCCSVSPGPPARRSWWTR